MSTARIDRVITRGIFSIDGEDFEVDNNIWLIGDDHECVILDAAHEAGPIVEGVDGRRVVALVCTHGHNDHINAARGVIDALSETGQHVPVMCHVDDRMLWDAVYPTWAPDDYLGEGDVVRVGGVELRVLHTPGHTPGGISLYSEDDGVVFGGDTLFKGGPGATGRSYSDFPTIIETIRTKLLVLPNATVVHTGHGDSTSIGDEAPQLDEWIARGH